jgi:hypothetical protein
MMMMMLLLPLNKLSCSFTPLSSILFPCKLVAAAHHIGIVKNSTRFIETTVAVAESLAFLHGVARFLIPCIIMFRTRPVTLNAHVVITTERADPWL